jgi:PAS domain S-box-containing protein
MKMLSIVNSIKNKVLDFINSTDTLCYSERLNKVLISQTHNPLFYLGNVKDGGKVLTKEVTDSINSDRCSIWLYNNDKTSIVCEQLYVKAENRWYDNIQLFEKDFKPYFDHLKIDPIIIANNAETHKATSCFTDTYLKPLGVKSMLDVPIIYKGEVIGVICIESLSLRKWKTIEVHFAQILSSLYTFAYSVKQTNKLGNSLIEFDKFVDASVLVSKADKQGKIVYVNKKFEDVSGWKLDEVFGKDHNVVNSGEHTKEFWSDMYKTVIKDKKIWNAIVTNKNKNGELYWVDSYIKAEFDENGDLSGFMSIRYDITDVIKKTKEIEEKNTYLEHAAKIIRHDMHSGINTYIPRGVNSLERRLTQEDIERLKIESPLKLIKDGLLHAQKVYRGVYEFTNLVKKDAVLTKTECNIKDILKDYLSSTAYLSQVILDDNLPTIMVNESLFCTAIDNLIRNGLKYNDSDTKFVKVYYADGLICIQDNGRGITQEDFNHLSKPYTRKENQKESGTGLGLNICVAILNEHGFKIYCEKNNIGTKITIKIN